MTAVQPIVVPEPNHRPERVSLPRGRQFQLFRQHMTQHRVLLSAHQRVELSRVPSATFRRLGFCDAAGQHRPFSVLLERVHMMIQHLLCRLYDVSVQLFP